MSKPIYVLSGPNLNLLGSREPHIYGTTTLEDIRVLCEARAIALARTIVFRQSNHEGELIDWVQAARLEACGLVINPAGARIQIEGGITQSLGYALSEEIHFKDGAIQDLNFDRYRLPHFSELPRIETVILDAPDLSAKGGGEPSVILMGALIANAVYDAVGIRMLQIPITPARLKAARAQGIVEYPLNKIVL